MRAVDTFDPDACRLCSRLDEDVVEHGYCVVDTMQPGSSYEGGAIAAPGFDTWPAGALLRTESYLRGLHPNGADLRADAYARFDDLVGDMHDADPFTIAGPRRFTAADALARAAIESPIERTLLVAILTAAPALERGVGAETCRIGAWALTAQRYAGRYRLDLALESRFGGLAIEADGHDFHERTKDQAAHDRRRDRVLQSAGWIVLRFTGAEIWRDADACAGEVLDHMARLEREGRS